MAADATWVAAVASLVILALVVFLVVARVTARSPGHVIKVKLLFVTIYSEKSTPEHPPDVMSDAGCEPDNPSP